MIVIPSVPHSGTMYTVKLFTELGYNQNSIVDEHVQDHCVRVGHIVKEGQYERAKEFIARGAIGVIPVRHPYLVAESWIRRGKDLHEMVKAYRRLPELYSLGCYPVPVDIPHKEYIDAIRDAGIPIRDSKKVVNSYHDTASLSWRDVEPVDEVKSLADELSEFLGIFY